MIFSPCLCLCNIHLVEFEYCSCKVCLFKFEMLPTVECPNWPTILERKNLDEYARKVSFFFISHRTNSMA